MSVGPVAQAEVAPSNTGRLKTMGAVGGEKGTKRKVGMVESNWRDKWKFE